MQGIKEELKVIRKIKNKQEKREEKWKGMIKDVEDKIKRMTAR